MVPSTRPKPRPTGCCSQFQSWSSHVVWHLPLRSISWQGQLWRLTMSELQRCDISECQINVKCSLLKFCIMSKQLTMLIHVVWYCESWTHQSHQPFLLFKISCVTANFISALQICQTWPRLDQARHEAASAVENGGRPGLHHRILKHNEAMKPTWWPNMTQHSNPQRNPQRKLKVVTDDVDDETWPSEKIQTPNQWHPYIHHVSVLGWVAASTCFWHLLTWQSSLPGSCGM